MQRAFSLLRPAEEDQALPPLLGLAFVRSPHAALSARPVALPGPTHAHIIVRVIKADAAKGMWRAMEMLYGSLLQAARHPGVPHNVACAAGVAALLKAGLLAAAKQVMPLYRTQHAAQQVCLHCSTA